MLVRQATIKIITRDLVKQFKHLTVLKLYRTSISGNGINKLRSLEYLKKINLVNSKFEAPYIEDMYLFPTLEKVYLFGTSPNISDAEIPDQYQMIFERENYKLDEDVEETL